MIITGGENVYSLEVEQALQKHASVAMVAVIGAPDERWGEKVTAFVVLREGATATEDELRQHCRIHLAGFKVPKTVIFEAALPGDTCRQNPEAGAAGKGKDRRLKKENNRDAMERRSKRLQIAVVILGRTAGAGLETAIRFAAQKARMVPVGCNEERGARACMLVRQRAHGAIEL